MPDDLVIVVGRRKIMWEPAPEPELVLPPIVLPDIIAESKYDGSHVLVESKRAYKKRIGNGHKSVKVRDLIDTERFVLKNELFLPKNGQINDDDCVDFKQQRKWGDVGIFQITGFISVLHTDVASGLMQVDNLVAYEQWMRTKYGETLWARYNLQLYVKTRAINASLISQGQAPIKAKQVKKEKVPDPKEVPVFNDQGDVVAVQGISLTPKFTSFRKRYAGA